MVDHKQSVIMRKNLYIKVKNIIQTHGRLSLYKLCELVSDNEGSVAVARNKVLRELDAASRK